jgi:hypothetical protein
MIIDIPTNHNFATVKFTLNRNIATSRSAFTNKQRLQEYDGVYWSAEVTLPPMKRADALEWTTFLTRLQGTKNTFLLGDPSHTTNAGTYDGDFLGRSNRIAGGSVTLNFTASTKTLTDASAGDFFDGSEAGDFILVAGASNDDNNGTFKITSVTSTNAVVVDRDIVDATSQSCTVNENVKGITGLNLSRVGTASGTIKKGDYLALHDGTTTSNPVQYVLVVEDSSGHGYQNSNYGVRIEPKLRADLPSPRYVKFASPKGQFRLASNQTSWSVNEASIYGLAFTAIEVING